MRKKEVRGEENLLSWLMMDDRNWEKRLNGLKGGNAVEKSRENFRKKTEYRTKKEAEKQHSDPEENNMFRNSVGLPMVTQKDGKCMARTEQALKKIAQEKGLEIGRRVRIERRSKDKERKYILRETEDGVVIGIYEHYFLVQIGNHKECFSYNELFGDEATKVRMRK